MAARADCDRTLARSYGHFVALVAGTEVGLLIDKTPDAWSEEIEGGFRFGQLGKFEAAREDE